MHWILVVNGDCDLCPQTRAILSSAERVIGVDGGNRHLHLAGLTPHLIVGDMDSIAPAVLQKYQEQGVEAHLHPPRKDATDLELALDLALERGACRVTILGGFGDRLDHTLGNLFVLARCLERHVPACLWAADQTAWLVDSHLEIAGKSGDIVSLLPLGAEVRGITLHGFEYALDKAVLPFGCTRGLSNVLRAARATIDVESGLLAVLHRR